MGLDTNYSVSAAEKDYVKNTLETEGVKALFQKEASGLQSKIINNFHSTNYSLFEQKKKLPKGEMIDVINKDPDMKAKYDAAFNKHKSDGGFSEGILLLQTLAIKCITVLKNNGVEEVVKDKLEQRSELGRKSDAMDGILGPNTFYVFASIAKDQGIPFNGVIDTKLIDMMVDICRADEPVVEEIPEEEIQTPQENIPEPDKGENIIPEPIIDETSEETQNIQPQIQPDIQETIIPEEQTNTQVPPMEVSEVNNEETKILDIDFKDNLKQDLDLNIKITNIDKLISEYPDVAKLIESMKHIGIDYQQAKTSNNKIDVDRVIAILNEIEYGNVADIQKIADMTWEMNLSGEQAVKFIIFYKMFERKEIINPDLTSIDTLRNSYKYTSNKDQFEKAAYEEKLLELYTTKTDEKDKRTIMKEYTRTILEKKFTEHNTIRTNNQGKIYNINGIGVGVFYNKETNEFIVNYITPDELPRKDEYQTVIFSKEDFLSKPAITAPEIVETPKVLNDYPEFVEMKTDLDNILLEIKDPFELYLLVHGFDKNNLRTEENTTETKLSKKFLYEDKEIVEIGIEIHEKKPQYFITYINQEEEKTQRSDDNISGVKLQTLMKKRIEQLYPNVTEYIQTKNYKNNLT